MQLQQYCEEIYQSELLIILQEKHLNIEVFFDEEKGLNHVYANTKKGKLIHYFFLFDDYALISGGCHTFKDVEDEVFFNSMMEVIEYIESKQKA